MSNLEDHEAEQAQITEQFTEAELAAAEAEAAALRAQLRAMAGAPLPSVAAPKLSPQEDHANRLRKSLEDGIVALTVKAPAEDPRVAAALAQRQALLDAQPKNRIAKALVPLLDVSWIQRNYGAPGRRTNDDRATDGAILANLSGMLAGAVKLEDQAMDAITNLMHSLNRNGMNRADIGELINMATDNFAQELDQAALDKINAIETRRAPAWAWAGIDAAMTRITDGYNDRYVAPEDVAGFANSFIGMKVATDTPDLAELTLDELSGHPHFAEIEDPDFAEVEGAR